MIKIKALRLTRWLHFSNSQLPIIGSNIPASPTYGVYISQRIRYSRACGQYKDFLDRAQLLTQKLFKQGLVAPRLKTSLQNFFWSSSQTLLTILILTLSTKVITTVFITVCINLSAAQFLCPAGKGRY